MSVRLSPDPPHLSVSVYPDQLSDETAFAAMCRVVHQAGGTPTQDVRVVPKAENFDALSDVGELIDTLEVNEERFFELITGADPRLKAVAADFWAEHTGLVVVTYDPRGPGDRRPVTALTHAEGLSLPEDLWTTAERQAGNKTGQWGRELLRAASTDLEPLYGALSIEDTLPTPSLLSTRGDRLTDIFVSTRLLRADHDLEFNLNEWYVDGDIEVWDNGLFLSGWAPFNQSGRSVADPQAVGQRTATLLARAAVP